MKMRKNYIQPKSIAFLVDMSEMIAGSDDHEETTTTDQMTPEDEFNTRDGGSSDWIEW